MIVAESHRSRRLIGRLEQGADLLPALVELATARHVRCGEVRAFGTLEDVDLREFDQRMRSFRPIRHFATPFTLIQLNGTLTEKAGRTHLEAHVALARERDNGIEQIGGHLARARVHAVEFIIDAFEDILIRRTLDVPTGLALISPVATDSAAAQAPEDPVPEGLTWSDVATASAAEAPPHSDEPGPIEPARAGDIIEHARFGQCEIERIEGEAEFAHVRLKNQRLVRLSLDVLQLVLIESQPDGRRYFRAITPK